MNPEQLQDALNELDDTLIAPVAQLRRRKLRWQHLGALAACLAVVCALGIYSAAARDRAQSGDDGSMEMVEENMPDSDSMNTPQEYDDAIVQVRAEREEESGKCDVNRPLPTTVVCIDSWQSDRFTCIVQQSGGTFSAGDSVTVLLTEDTLVSLGEDTLAWTMGELPFAEGTLVSLCFVPGPEKGMVYAAILSPAE